LRSDNYPAPDDKSIVFRPYIEILVYSERK